MEYIVVSGNDINELREAVHQGLDEGYKLQGGISVNSNAVQWGYFQAMIK